MFKRFTFSRPVIKSALALHVSLLSLTACNGSQPLPLFSSVGSGGGAGSQASGQAGGEIAKSQASAAGQIDPSTGVAVCNPCNVDMASGNGGGSHDGSKSSGNFEKQLPVYHVVGHGLSASQARALGASFGLDKLELEADGSVSYLDEARFQHIPLKGEATNEYEFKTQMTSPQVTAYQAPTYQKMPTYTFATPKPSPTSLQESPQPYETPGPLKPGQDVIIDQYTHVNTQVSTQASDYQSEEGEAIRPQFFDLPALRQIKALPEDVALDRILIGLNKAGLKPLGKPILGHSEFEMRAAEGGDSIKVQLDTQVGFEQSLGQLKLIGPGAKVKVVMDGEGVVTQLRYASRQLRGGEQVAIMPPAEAEQMAMQQLNQENPGFDGKWEVSSELVYYAPPLSQEVKTIFPHYMVKAELRAKGQEIQSRLMMLPAIQKGLKIKVDLNMDGGVAKAEARVEGGTAPYRYSWSSANGGELNPRSDQSPSIGYELSGRMRSDKETLYLTVTDANGLTSSAQASKSVNASLLKLNDVSSFSTQMPGRFDAGAEWVGLSQGLGGSRDNAKGFVDGFRGRGTPVEFNFGDYAAWEEDFKMASRGGTDNNYVDNVDMAFYTGHANGNLFTFPGSHDDGWLEYTDGSYGERELEWLMIAACGPMQQYEGGMHLFDRWGRVFKGLHLLAGYATVSFDNTVEGEKLARKLLAENRTVRSAWAQMASEVQPASVTYGYMGVIGPGGLSNWDDHFWGHGVVGPDIHDVRGYWSVHSPS